MTELRLKRIAEPIRHPATAGDYVGLENVEGGTGRLLGVDSEADPASAIAFRAGDVLYGKLRPYLRKVLVTPFDGRCSSEFLVLRPVGTEPRFLAFLLLGDRLTQWAVTNSDGAKMPRTEWGALSQAVVTVPELTSQRAIVAYLDRETANIDTIVDKKRHLLELYIARSWRLLLALIDAAGAPRIALRRALESLTDGPFGSAFSSDDYSEDGAAVVRLGNIGFGEYRSQDQAYIPASLYQQFPRCHISPGDVLIAGLGDSNNHAGRACVAPDLGPAMVKGKCFCARVDRSRVDPRYLAWLLSSPLGAELVGAFGQGSTRTMINLRVVKALEVPMPPLGVQEAILGEFSHQHTRRARARRMTEHQIGCLQEMRQALITGAVTGQIDIPGAA